MTVATLPFRLVLAGVGGQGCVTTGRVIGAAAVAEGLDARVGELHGLSQRGGSVQSTVSIGPGRTSHVQPGEADVVLGLEPLEALRALPFASRRTLVLVNLAPVVPPALTLREVAYPSPADVLARLRRVAGRVAALDATALAHEAGSLQSLDTVLLGALAGLGVLPFPGEALAAAIEGSSPARHRETNRRAFALGLRAGAALREEVA